MNELVEATNRLLNAVFTDGRAPLARQEGNKIRVGVYTLGKDFSDAVAGSPVAVWVLLWDVPGRAQRELACVESFPEALVSLASQIAADFAEEAIDILATDAMVRRYDEEQQAIYRHEEPPQTTQALRCPVCGLLVDPGSYGEQLIVATGWHFPVADNFGVAYQAEGGSDTWNGTTPCVGSEKLAQVETWNEEVDNQPHAE